jgi:trimethylamine--corrinoid protein Co-methyltransferase
MTSIIAGGQDELRKKPIISFIANHFSGTLLDGGAIADFGALVIQNELAGMVQRMCQGIEVSPDTLAVGIIEELGPGHNYKSMKHMRKYYRKERWLEYKISEKHKWESCKSEGAATAYQKAREEAKILATHVPQLLTDTERDQRHGGKKLVKCDGSVQVHQENYCVCGHDARNKSLGRI